MAKKRRTREQKVRADLRHHAPLNSKESPVIESLSQEQEIIERSPIFQFKATQIPAKKESKTEKPLTANDRVLYHDLRKTGILTLAILITQVALYFFIQTIT